MTWESTTFKTFQYWLTLRAGPTSSHLACLLPPGIGDTLPAAQNWTLSISRRSLTHLYNCVARVGDKMVTPYWIESTIAHNSHGICVKHNKSVEVNPLWRRESVFGYKHQVLFGFVWQEDTPKIPWFINFSVGHAVSMAVSMVSNPPSSQPPAPPIKKGINS